MSRKNESPQKAAMREGQKPENRLCPFATIHKSYIVFLS